MLGALSAIGSIFSFLGSLLKAAISFVIYRSGEKAQQQKDQAATLAATEREQQAAASAPKDKDEAMQRLKDGSA